MSALTADDLHHLLWLYRDCQGMWCVGTRPDDPVRRLNAATIVRLHDLRARGYVALASTPNEDRWTLTEKALAIVQGGAS